jgi:hypothetical protein
VTGGEASPQGRRILIAPVAGESGRRIQRWRERYDPEQARRIPPHVTLCYWAPVVEPTILEPQIRHAYNQAILVQLGAVQEFDNADRTLYVSVLGTSQLDGARRRLYDGTYLQLPGRADWTWHVTCVRTSRGRDMARLRVAAEELNAEGGWLLDTISYLELRGDRYEMIAEWRIDRRHG